MPASPRLAILFIWTAVCHAQTGSEAEPVRYMGGTSIDLYSHDGGLRPAIGASNYQVLRSNRSRPELGDGSNGWTFTHAPMLAYWNGKFYLQYYSNEVSEPTPPGHTLLTMSVDGKNWQTPVVTFPPYQLPSGEILLPHQRMGFYVAPNGRLLVSGAFIHAPAPRAGAIGRLVREIYRDDQLGPIYFIRYNRHRGWNEGNTKYPFYKESPDAGFLQACEALLNNKLVTQQWWEEDRSDDDFYALKGQYEALSFYHRKDGNVAGVFKNSLAALSRDEGRSWSTPVKAPTIVMDGAKIWGQRTKDSRFALLYNPVNDSPHRWPLAIISGDDGITFDDMLLVHGEVPPRRFLGMYKAFGPQYVRGIVEGNGIPPGNDLWVTYSVNKEDIWVSRVPLPVRSRVSGPVQDSFDSLKPGAFVANWNIYSPRWAPVHVADFPGPTDKSLELSDRDPYDYAKAVRVFPVNREAAISFKLFVKGPVRGDLEIELLDEYGHRPVRLAFAANEKLKVQDGARWIEAQRFKAGEWYDIRIAANSGAQRFTLTVNGVEVVRQAAMAEAVDSVERLAFRTGTFRDEPTRRTDHFQGVDLPGADFQVGTATYYIDDVTIR